MFVYLRNMPKLARQDRHLHPRAAVFYVTGQCNLNCAYCEDFVMHNFFWLERMYTPYRTWSGFTGGSAIEVHIYGPQEKRDQPDALLLTETITDFYRAYPELRGHLTFQHRSAERGAPHASLARTTRPASRHPDALAESVLRGRLGTRSAACVLPRARLYDRHQGSQRSSVGARAGAVAAGGLFATRAVRGLDREVDGAREEENSREETEER